MRIPVFDRFDSTLMQFLPYAWIVPAEHGNAIELLRRHGMFIEEVEMPTAMRVEQFVIDSVIQSQQPFQGHRETRLTGRWERADSLPVAPGTYIVRAGQPLGILALYLLDPQSDDGLVTWNFLDQWLRSGERYPIARVVTRITVPLRPLRGD